LDLMLLNADRREFAESVPSAAHAARCQALDESQLLDVCRSGRLPDRATYDHLNECAYCRQRLLLMSGDARMRGQASLRHELTEALIAPALHEAAQNVAKAVAPSLLWHAQSAARKWLKTRLRAWMDEGRLVAEGLRSCLAAQPPSQAVAALRVRGATRARQERETPADQEREWRIPLPELEGHVVVHVRPAASGESWEVRCTVQSGKQAAIAEGAHVTIAQPGQPPRYDSREPTLARTLAQIPAGAWEITVQVGDDVRVISLELGPAAEA